EKPPAEKPPAEKPNLNCSGSSFKAAEPTHSIDAAAFRIAFQILKRERARARGIARSMCGLNLTRYGILSQSTLRGERPCFGISCLSLLRAPQLIHQDSPQGERGERRSAVRGMAVDHLPQVRHRV